MNWPGLMAGEDEKKIDAYLGDRPVGFVGFKLVRWEKG